MKNEKIRDIYQIVNRLNTKVDIAIGDYDKRMKQSISGEFKEIRKLLKELQD